ncbi:MAG: DUF2726 domain-containing protein [Gammaproteobacteria bacterium]
MLESLIPTAIPILVILICLFLILTLVSAFLYFRSSNQEKPASLHQYRIKSELLDETAVSFKLAIEQVLPPTIKMLPHISLSHILEPRVLRAHDPVIWHNASTVLEKRFFDFVLFHFQKEHLKPLGGIDLIRRSVDIQSMAGTNTYRTKEAICKIAKFPIIQLSSLDYQNKSAQSLLDRLEPILSQAPDVPSQKPEAHDQPATLHQIPTPNRSQND